MEKSLKFNSQVCTSVEQSKRLLDLGLKPETADMCWFNDMQKPFCTPYKCFVDRAQDMKWVIFPAWSLHRLLCLYGQDYTIKELYNNAEECYGMLISAIGIAIENNEFNKEYLKL